MRKLSALNMTALILTMVGGLNWGLVGFLKFDLVEALLGSMSVSARVVYGLVGLSALYLLSVLSKLRQA